LAAISLTIRAVVPRRRSAGLGLLVAAALVAGCAGHGRPKVVDAGITAVPPSEGTETTAPAVRAAAIPPPMGETEDTLALDVVVPEPTPTPAEQAAAPQEAAAAAGQPAQQDQSLRELCRQDPTTEGFLDESRRLLAQTFCGATLWFDGLFGGTPDVQSARAVSGRLELSGLHTDFEGFDGKVRLRLNYDLPNLERRVRLFLGREERSFVSDRQEGFAIRSAVFGLEDRDEWLAGLGYRPPGRYLERVDFRVGARIKTSPEVFVQSRYRRNFFLGQNDVWRFRETLFWENRDGFGITSSMDWDRVLRRDLLVRWGNVGTYSEATQGVEWRSALVFYKNLRDLKAVAAEGFSRGATDAEVKFREIGVRGIYRHPLRPPFFFGDVIAGYTWPRKFRDQPREGSAMIGVGFELLFGNEPY